MTIHILIWLKLVSLAGLLVLIRISRFRDKVMFPFEDMNLFNITNEYLEKMCFYLKIQILIHVIFSLDICFID
jgi:hypothetical protein